MEKAKPRTDEEINEGMRKRIGQLGKAGAVAASALAGSMTIQAAKQEVRPARAGNTTPTRPVGVEESQKSLKPDIVGTPDDKENFTESIEWLPSKVKTKWNTIEQIAKGYDLDPKLVAIIIAEESGGDEKANNPSGAKGLFQIMPGTEKSLAKKLGYSKYDIFDPKTNLEFGCYLMRYLNDRYIAPSGIDLDSQQGVALLAIGMSGGEGDLQTFIRTGDISRTIASRQNQSAVNLWTSMWQDRNKPESQTYKNLRGQNDL